MIVQIVASNLHGDAVELDVRTLRDVLVERRLVDRCIGAGECHVCTRRQCHAPSILDSPPSILASMLKLAPGSHHISAGAASVAGRRAVGVVIDQVVDLINIELVAIAVQRLVHHVGHDDGTRRVEVVEIDNRAAQAVGASGRDRPSHPRRR